jgi:hypothetical protein
MSATATLSQTPKVSSKVLKSVRESFVHKPLPDDIKEFVDLETQMNHIENLYAANPVELRQSDFDNGTVRLTQPGVYKLMENISFNPNPSTWNSGTNSLSGDDWMPTAAQTSGGANATYPIQPHGPYHMGFFAAISTEAQYIVLDLNGFTLEQNIAHYLQQRFFSTIELASQPFIPRQGPSNFGSSFVAGSYIKIKNGNLGRTSHLAIHGNSMHHVILQDLNIFNYEQAGIGLNGGEYIHLDNVCIGRNSYDTLVRATYSQARFIRSFVQNIIDNGSDPSITIKGVSKSGSTILSELVQSLDGVYKDIVIDKQIPTNTLYRNTSKIVDGSVYGLVLNVKGVAVNQFLETAPTDRDAVKNQHILITRMRIRNLTSEPNEVIGLYTGSGGSYGLPVQKGPAGDVVRITEVEDSTTREYVPDVLTNAQMYVAKYQSTLTTPSTTLIDSGLYDTWIAGSASLTSVVTSPTYVCGGDAMAHVMKGNIGMFISGCYNLKMYDVTIDHVVNNGALSDPTYCNSSSSGTTAVYDGNRCRGVAMVSSNTVMADNLSITNVQSKTADAKGIDFIGQNSAITIQNYNIQDIIAAEYIASGDYPNVAPHAFLVDNTANVTGLTMTPMK